MEMETVFDFIPEQTETSPEPETSLSPDPLESSDPIEESSPFVESVDPEESEPASGSEGSVSVSKEESVYVSKPSCPTFGTTINETVQAIGY